MYGTKTARPVKFDEHFARPMDLMVSWNRIGGHLFYQSHDSMTHESSHCSSLHTVWVE